MGLIDMTHIICVRGYPVATLISGQYLPADGPSEIKELVARLGIDWHANLQLTESTREALLEAVKKLPPTPKDVQERMEAAVDTIQRIAEAEFKLRKAGWEQEFLDQLRHTQASPGEPTRVALGNQVHRMLEQIVEFCHCTYAVFFGSVQEKETVLVPIAHAGLPQEVAQQLPHFNWKKAGLAQIENGVKRWPISRGGSSVCTRGIRGDNSDYFFQSSCIVPTSLGDRYLGTLVLGPIKADVNLEQEKRFLYEMTDVVGSVALTGLEVLYLERERRRWQSTARLLTHQLRTALTPIASQTGIAKALVDGGGRIDTRRVSGLLGRAENLAMRVARRARQTMEGHVLQFESEDLDFERHPLSVLIANCTAGFEERARQHHLDLLVDERVEYLPEADVDVARLTIALANLIDNAIKYSFPDTTIYIRSRFEADRSVKEANAVIEVDNLGYEIAYEDRERIFERGQRGLVAAKLGHIEGSGLGLWEARAIAAAHGGKISMRCDRTARRTRLGQAYHIVFAITIPLRQPKTGREARDAKRAEKAALFRR
jgi:signal transduction histidine kinase